MYFYCVFERLMWFFVVSWVCEWGSLPFAKGIPILCKGISTLCEGDLKLFWRGSLPFVRDPHNLRRQSPPFARFFILSFVYLKLYHPYILLLLLMKLFKCFFSYGLTLFLFVICYSLMHFVAVIANIYRMKS